MALKVKKSAKPPGKAGTRSRLPDLSRFYCVGLTIEGSISDPDSWKRVSQHSRKALTAKPEKGGWDLGFDYEPRKGRKHSVRLCLERLIAVKLEWFACGPDAVPKPRRIPSAGTGLTLVVYNHSLTGEILPDDPHLLAALAGYEELAPYHSIMLRGEHGPWPFRRERADASALRAVLRSLAALVPTPVEFTVDAVFYLRLHSEWVVSWGRKWPKLGSVDVTGVSLSAREAGLDVMLRLVDEEDEVKGLFVSVNGVKMESALDAGILERACQAASDSVLPFVRLTLKDGKK